MDTAAKYIRYTDDPKSTKNVTVQDSDRHMLIKKGRRFYAHCEHDRYFYGAGGTRTPDFIDANDALCQLSHSPIYAIV